MTTVYNRMFQLWAYTVGRGQLLLGTPARDNLPGEGSLYSYRPAAAHPKALARRRCEACRSSQESRSLHRPHRLQSRRPHEANEAYNQGESVSHGQSFTARQK